LEQWAIQSQNEKKSAEQKRLKIEALRLKQLAKSSDSVVSSK
jgi:hypothetical protein